MRHKKPKMRIHIIILHLFSFYFFCFSIIKQFFRFNFSTSQPSAKFVRCLWDAGYEWWMDNAVVLWGFSEFNVSEMNDILSLAINHICLILSCRYCWGWGFAEAPPHIGITASYLPQSDIIPCETATQPQYGICG